MKSRIWIILCLLLLGFSSMRLVSVRSSHLDWQRVSGGVRLFLAGTYKGGLSGLERVGFESECDIPE
jgi:hypothetical protein